MNWTRGNRNDPWIYDDLKKDYGPIKWKYFSTPINSTKKVLLRVSTNRDIPIYERSRKGMWQRANQKQVGIIKTLLLLEG
jgi:hypothetical protein